MIVSALSPFVAQGQAKNKAFKQDDVWSIFTRESKQAARDSVSLAPPRLYKPYIAVTPFIGYNPAYGMLIGVGSTVGLYLGKPVTTPLSSAVVSVNFTSKAQKILNLRTNVITNECRK